MKQTFEEYRHEVLENAEWFAQREEVRERENHLRAYNLGRMVERIQNHQTRARWPVPWLLVGLVIGMVCGRIFPVSLYRNITSMLLPHASLIQKTTRNTGVR